MREYNFNISLSVLNHLGRNLYRSFMTILGEAISNAWDADAKNVWININRDEKTFSIADDGDGMSEDDFQDKFLKIGYSKRKDNISHTVSGRPFIGRKGIGKLALLSCSNKITIITKALGGDITAGTIDNSSLDNAIQEDVAVSQYNLALPSTDVIKQYWHDREKGTTIVFEQYKEDINNRVSFIKKLIAYDFRFSVLDSDFKIFVNDDEVGVHNLNDLIDATQFMWIINNADNDLFANQLLQSSKLVKSEILSSQLSISGFIASVEKPSNLKLRGSQDKVSIDLFVNGRLREKNILSHIPTTRIVESYLYGQIHCNFLDDETDRFTSSREGIVPNDSKYKEILDEISVIIKDIIDKWDKWRVDNHESGDADNSRMTKKERKSRELYDEIASDYSRRNSSEAQGTKLKEWINELSEDAAFNYTSYGECFIAENLLRKYIDENHFQMNEQMQQEVTRQRRQHQEAKNRGNVNINIREHDNDLSYLDMDRLANLAESNNTHRGEVSAASFIRDSKEYKPIRDAMAHTARLTQEAKRRLTSTYENISARISNLLSNI